MISKINRYDISKSEFISIIYNTITKVVRGIVIKPFFRESKGLFFIGDRAKLFIKKR